MQRIFIVSIFVFVLFVAASKEVIACSCGGGVQPSEVSDEDLADWLKNTESIIFEGQVVSVKSVYVNGKGQQELQ